MNVNVGIGVGGGKVLERENFAVGLQLAAGGKSLLWKSFGRRRRKSHVEDGNGLFLGHALFCVFVGENRSASGAKSSIVVGVVEVPVGVDDVLQGSIAEAVQVFFELGPSGRNEGINDELALGAVEDHDVAAWTGEQREIVRELLRLNGSRAHPCAKRRQRVGCRGLLWVAKGGCAYQATGKHLCQESAAGKRGRAFQEFAASRLFPDKVGIHESSSLFCEVT